MYPTWRDEDGDGTAELVLVAYNPSAVSAGNQLPPRTAAVFDWTAPGGVLRPRSMPADSSVSFWAPPEGRPIPFAPDQSLDSVIDQAMAQFAPAATEPATTQSAP